MAIDTSTLSTLYQRYLGRTPSADEIAGINSGGYDTPSKVEGLLATTRTKGTSDVLGTIKGNIQSLSTGGSGMSNAQSLYGGKLPDYGTFMSSNPAYQQAEGQYQQTYNYASNLGLEAQAAPSKAKAALQAGSAFFGETYDDLQQKFSDPNSPWFVRDNASRETVIGNAMKQKYNTMNDVIGKIGDVYNVLTQASQNELAGQREKVANIQKTLEKSYDALMSYYGQQMADENARKMAETEHGYRMQEIGASKSLSSGSELKNVTLPDGTPGVFDPNSGRYYDANGNLYGNPGNAEQTLLTTGVQRTRNGVNGYDFKDDKGNPITIDRARKLSGLPMIKLLEGSEDEGDKAKVDSLRNLDQAFSFASSKINNDKQLNTLTNKFKQYYDAGDTKNAANFIMKTARDTTDATTSQQVLGRTTLVDQMSHIQDLLNRYEKKQGTGIKLKLTESGLNYIGSTINPEVAKLATEIQSALQLYRRSITGAQFGEQESKEYQRIFPSIGHNATFNAGQIAGLIDQAQRANNIFYQNQLGDGADYIQYLSQVSPSSGNTQSRGSGGGGGAW